MAVDVRARLKPPVFFGGDFAHILGTDQLGRDVFSRALISIRISLTIAICATMLSTVVGVTLGFIAAYFRSWVDQVILTFVDAQLAIPVTASSQSPCSPSSAIRFRSSSCCSACAAGSR